MPRKQAIKKKMRKPRLIAKNTQHAKVVQVVKINNATKGRKPIPKGVKPTPNPPQPQVVFMNSSQKDSGAGNDLWMTHISKSIQDRLANTLSPDDIKKLIRTEMTSVGTPTFGGNFIPKADVPIMTKESSEAGIDRHYLSRNLEKIPTKKRYTQRDLWDLHPTALAKLRKQTVKKEGYDTD